MVNTSEIHNLDFAIINPTNRNFIETDIYIISHMLYRTMGKVYQCSSCGRESHYSDDFFAREKPDCMDCGNPLKESDGVR